MRRRGDRDQGASFTEYLALGVLAALVITGLVASGLPAHLTGAVRTTVCRVVGECHPAASGADRPGADPPGRQARRAPRVPVSPYRPSAGTPATRADTWYNSGHKFVSDTKDFFGGAASAVLDELKGLGETARLFPCWGFGLCSKQDDQTVRWIGDHPTEVAKSLWHSATDPCRKVAENPDDTANRAAA